MKSSNEEQRSLTTPECRTKKHKLRKQKDAGKFPPKKFPLMKHVFAKQFDDIFSKVQETDREISEWINNDNESKTIPCSTKKRKSLTQISEDVSPQKQRKSPILCKIKLSSSGENSQRHSDTESMKNFKKRDVTSKWNDKSPNKKMRLSWSKRKNRKALKKEVNLDNRQQSLTSFFQCSSKSTETVAMQCKKEEELWVISDSQCDVNCTDMKQKEGILEKQHMNISVKSQIKYFDSNSENVRMRFKKMKEIRVSDSTGKCDKITPEEESLQKQHHCTPHKSRTTDCDSNSRSPFHLPKHAVTTVRNMVLNAKRINSLSALRRHQIDKIYSVEKNSNSEELTNEEQRINSPEGMTNTEEAVDSPDGMTNIKDVKSADSAEMIRSSGKKSGKMKVSVVKKSAMDILMANRSRKRQDNVTQLQRTELETGINSEGSEIKDDQTRNTGKRGCPFYKKIPETGFTVDAFSYGIIPNCTGYILSHFHYDHYCGLTKNFNQPIYCSQVTANLVISRIKVDEKYVHAIPMNTPCLIDGIEIIMLEANHCPGSVLILLKLKSGRIILHTGDFRADKSMEDYPEFKGIHVSQLYLDTTYCNPSYAFPPQQEVIDFTINLVQQEIKQNANTLVVCGSYTIGKERIFIAIAKALRCKICVYREKKQILSCLDDSDLMQQISLNFNDSQLHVLKLGKLNPQGLTNHLNSLKTKYSNVLALEPTGWSFSKIKSLYEIQPKYNRNGIKIYGIPYSEHSSYLELKRFVQFIRPDRILPTVNNGNPNSRKKMESIFKSWFNEMEKGSSNKVTVKQSALSKWFH